VADPAVHNLVGYCLLLHGVPTRLSVGPGCLSHIVDMCPISSWRRSNRAHRGVNLPARLYCHLGLPPLGRVRLFCAVRPATHRPSARAWMASAAIGVCDQGRHDGRMSTNWPTAPYTLRSLATRMSPAATTPADNRRAAKGNPRVTVRWGSWRPSAQRESLCCFGSGLGKRRRGPRSASRRRRGSSMRRRAARAGHPLPGSPARRPRHTGRCGTGC
jgi:hypothetical protein